MKTRGFFYFLFALLQVIFVAFLSPASDMRSIGKVLVAIRFTRSVYCFARIKCIPILNKQGG